MAVCSIHGTYIEQTAPGCPGCRMINAAPQVYQPTWSGTTSPDFFGSLLRERDRYRDALIEIVRTIEDATEEDDEIPDLVQHVAKRALDEKGGST